MEKRGRKHWSLPLGQKDRVPQKPNVGRKNRPIHRRQGRAPTPRAIFRSPRRCRRLEGCWGRLVIAISSGWTLLGEKLEVFDLLTTRPKICTQNHSCSLWAWRQSPRPSNAEGSQNGRGLRAEMGSVFWCSNLGGLPLSNKNSVAPPKGVYFPVFSGGFEVWEIYREKYAIICWLCRLFFLVGLGYSPRVLEFPFSISIWRWLIMLGLSQPTKRTLGFWNQNHRRSSVNLGVLLFQLGL